MNISETFIRRPIATSLMMLGLLVFGAATYNLLPVAALPNVDFPTITVSATLPGASPETMASSVATPLEQQFAAIPGLASMNSTSGLGTTSITLQFDLNRAIDGAATDVQTAINAASGLLPKDLPNPPTYRKVNPADRAILIYAVTSDDLPIYKVDDYAFTILAQKISAVTGVSQVLVAGQQDFAVRVQANPSTLAAHGISLEDVRNAVAGATVNQAKGNLENEHQSITIDTNDQLFHAPAYRNIIVAYRNGAPVKLQDVADVVDARRGAFNVVVVWRFDRFARSVKQLVLALEEFRCLGIDFVSHQEALDTSTPMGKAMFTVIAAMAELERGVIRERVLAGLEYARQRGIRSGRPVGRPPAVFRRDQALVPTSPISPEFRATHLARSMPPASA